MAVFRVVKDKENPYIMINKHYIYDKRLSLKAKGLMSYFLSRPDDWEFYQAEILNHCTDKKDSLSKGIKELENAGYIRRTFKRDSSGKLKGGYEYEIYETPCEISESELIETPDADLPKPGKTEIGENRNREIPVSENPPLLNNDSLLNKDSLLNNEVSSRGIDEIIRYYCSKANILEVNISPVEFEVAIKLIEDSIPIKTIKYGIDLSFKNFKPKFSGDKIKSLKYCDSVIRSQHAKELVKMGGNKNGTRSNSGQNNNSSETEYDFSNYGKQGTGESLPDNINF